MESEPSYDMNIHSNPDARAWAEFWVSNIPNVRGGIEKAIYDVDFMQGWFANAMMAMHDHLLSKKGA